MHKISTFTGQARHGWERMTPAIGLGSRPQVPDLSVGPHGAKRSAVNNSTIFPDTLPPGHQINLSFNVPFATGLAGPDVEEVIYASQGAFDRWTHADSDGEPCTHELFVHKQNEENLRALCRSIGETTAGEIQATVTTSKPKPVPGMQRASLTSLVTNVCISGETELVQRFKARVLNETPITLVCCASFMQATSLT